MNQVLKKVDLTEKFYASHVFPNAVFLAEAEQEQFEELRIVTLNSYVRDQATELALLMGCRLSSVEKAIQRLTPTFERAEFIEVDRKEIRMVLNVDLIDDHVVNRALTILSKIDEFVPGTKIYINEL